jgi:uncharacterized Ntn-hydrolase superfamily protein
VRSPLLALATLLLLAGCAGAPAAQGPPRIATFSIVAVDRETGELGVAVESKFIAVGAVVPYAKAGVGAVATQALGNTTFGPEGLALMAKGTAPAEALAALLAKDPRAARRQVALVDAQGRVAAHTGARCLEWAGDVQGEGFSCQGNILAGEAVVQAMSKAYRASEGVLAERLLAALEAGQRAGGDRRGRQSAALLVVHEGWGYGGLSDRFRDLRVDDHPTPIAELRRIYGLHRKVFPRPE